MIAGLDTLAELRTAGRVPRMVNVETGVKAHRHLQANVAAMNATSGDLCWHVVVTPEEAASRLDLRALCGLAVEVDGTEPLRLEAVAAACEKAGAARVIATLAHFDSHGTCRIVAQSDTQGILDGPMAA